MGLGFALSSNDTKFIVDRLLQYGRVKAGWVGVDLQDLSGAIALSFRDPQTEGAVVTAVTPGSPAMSAGITEGDIIQGIDDASPHDARDAARRFAYLPVGTTAHVTIWRARRSITVDVRAAEIPGAEKADNPAPLLNQFATTGLKLSPLTDQVRQTANMAPGQSGALVTGVPNNVFTGQSILLPGDVVLRVQQTSVASPEEVEHCIAQAQTEGLVSVALLVQRKTGRSWIPLLVGDLTTIKQ
jgi:serine protease Do